MSQGIEQYASIIEQLKPVINEPGFNQVVSRIAGTVPKPKQFLIKMELRRQSRPCDQIIDLRNEVEDECQPHEYDGIIHFLNNDAIQVFERQVRAFGGYTQGVFEAVMNTEKSLKLMQDQPDIVSQQEESEETEDGENTTQPGLKYATPTIHFAGYAKRNEERMNFSINIEMFTELNESMNATTLDLSVRGLKIKAPHKYLFKPGEKLSVHFRGLESEYSLNRRMGIAYQITDIDRNREEQRVSLRRVEDKPNPEFDKFVEHFIRGNKGRYKVNMDNTIMAIMAKGYEQYYIPQITSIPIFIEEKEGVLTPRFILTNDSNKQNIFFWADEKNKLRLGYLLSHKRITQLLELPGTVKETLIYAFNRVHEGRSFFYSATREELNANPDIKATFLGYGARRASWRVYKVQLSPMRPEQCHLPLSLPDSVSDTVRKQNQPPPPRLMAKLKSLAYVALVTDISDELSSRPYLARKPLKSKLSGIKAYAHSRVKPPKELSLFRFKYQNLRNETRFQLRTKVVLSVAGKSYEGVTEDISLSGIKVELDNVFSGKKLWSVAVAFPELQKMTKKYILSDLSYEVRNVSKEGTVVNLAVLKGKNEDHVSQLFFEELIKNNRSKLKFQLDEEEIPGIGEALRNIYSANVMNMGLYLKKEAGTLLPDGVSIPQTQHSLLPLLSFQATKNELNLYPLFAVEGEQDFMHDTCRPILTESPAKVVELFIAFNPEKLRLSEAVISRHTSDFKNDKERKEFISRAMANGRFYAIKLFITRTRRPDTEQLNSELNYVGIYAIHRAKMLEDQLWNVHYMSDVIDTSIEVMERYAFNLQKIADNQEKYLQR